MSSSIFPLVDVCIITYNQVSLIKETLISILNQDYPNFKIIISDDCSQDGTQKVIEDMAKLHLDKIQVNLNPKNLGITENANLALSLSKADYVIVFSGDDLMHPNRISKQVQHLQSHPTAAGSITSVIVENISKKESYTPSFPDFESEKFSRILTTYNQIPSAALMINRNVVPNIQYDIRTPIVSDWLLVNEIALQGIIYINEPLTIYRRHPTNTTAKGIDKIYLADRLIGIDILFEKVKNHYWKFRHARSNVYLSAASRYWQGKQRKDSIRFTAYSFLEYPFNKEIYLTFLKKIYFKAARIYSS